MTIVRLQRVFRMGATDFPDPDPDLEPSQVLKHFSNQYPQLQHATISAGEPEGDTVVFTMTTSYKPNG